MSFSGDGEAPPEEVVFRAVKHRFERESFSGGGEAPPEGVFRRQ